MAVHLYQPCDLATNISLDNGLMDVKALNKAIST